MNILELLKRNGKKEYMKYEDGKIIPVKVEENKNYQELNLSPAEQKEEIKKAIKEKVDMPGKVKRYGTVKMLKIIISIAIIIFFGFTVKDIYIAFTESEPPVVEVEPVNKGSDPIPETPTDKGSFTPGNDTIGTVDPPKEEPKEDEQKPVEGSKDSSLKQAIDASNVVNNMMVSEMAKEIAGMNEHFDNKMNKFTFEKRLKGSLETKEQLAQYLQERKALFVDEEILSFYDATEVRLQNSTDMTRLVLDSFDSYMTETELKDKVDGHIQRENELKEEQKAKFLQLLKDKNIEHSVDDLKGEISYTIK